MAEPIDIVMLTYNRLDHLVATVEALEARTPEPYRLTIVDNASGADVRTWLADNRHRFHRVILRPTNEHLPAFQYGIEATTSDPFIIAEPDLIVPDLEPSWLARLRGLLDAHPDFGLIAMGLDPGNRPDVLGEEELEPATVVDEDLVEGNVGIWFQIIRRTALLVPFELDAQACEAVRSAGWRVGWTRTLRAWHLGWDDYKLHPGHLASKSPRTHRAYPHYREIGLIERPPTLTELANAAPVMAITRAAGIPDVSVIELAWGAPAIAAAVPGPVAATAPACPLPLEQGAAGAVVLLDPPVERADGVLADAFRVAAHTVVALAPLTTFGGHLAADLAPAGWSAREAPGPAEVPLALAAAGDADPALHAHLGYRTLEQRAHWLELFAAGAFGAGSRRLWIWHRHAPLAIPEAVAYDPALLRPWRGEAPPPPAPPALTLQARLRGRLHRVGLRRRVRAAQSVSERAPARS
jgi:hypothetical protein